MKLDERAIRVITSVAGLKLPTERVTQLAETLTTFREGMARLRQADPGDAEPPCLTFDEEARR